MNAARILSKATSLGVSLRLDGDMVRIRGPRDARETILAAVAANKSEIMAYLRRAANDIDLARYPVADGGGPYSPYVLPMSPERVAGLLNDLRASIGKLADMEGWPDAHRRRVLDILRRQPAYTLADDLAYFRERLDALRAADCAVDTLVRTCGTCAHRDEHSHGVKVRCAMARALDWRHHHWLDDPDRANDCTLFEQR